MPTPTIRAVPGRASQSPRSSRIRVVSALTFATAAAMAVTGAVNAHAAPSPRALEARSVAINVVTINDFHGRLHESGWAGGIARLATAVNEIRAENPNTIFAAAGGIVGDTDYPSAVFDDEPSITTFNMAGLDVSAIGTHELANGFHDLSDRVMPAANWQYLGANLYDPISGKVAAPEFWTVKFKSVTIGFIGVVSDEATIDGVTVGDPVDAANRVAAQLRDGKKKNGEADIVILLAHEGAESTDIESATDPDTSFGRLVLNASSGIDAIVSGGTHLVYNHVIDGRPVISNGAYGERFSNLEIRFDQATKSITKIENSTHTIVAIHEDGTASGYAYNQDSAIGTFVEDLMSRAIALIREGDLVTVRAPSGTIVGPLPAEWIHNENGSWLAIDGRVIESFHYADWSFISVVRP